MTLSGFYNYRKRFLFGRLTPGKNNIAFNAHLKFPDCFPDIFQNVELLIVFERKRITGVLP
jgi:hypothetical protein